MWQLLVDVDLPREIGTVRAISRLFRPTVHVLWLWRNDVLIVEPNPTMELRLGDRLVVASRRHRRSAPRSDSPLTSP